MLFGIIYRISVMLWAKKVKSSSPLSLPTLIANRKK